MKEVGFLGHVISGEGIVVDPIKVVTVTNWVAPTTVEEIQSFLGLAGYYRRFIEFFQDCEANDGVIEEGYQI